MKKKKKINITVNIKPELIADLTDFSHQVCVGAAAFVRDTLYNTTIEAFERFYCDYTPVSGSYPCSYNWKFVIPDGQPKEYIRTFNILENKVVNKFNENKHGKIIRGGIRLLPDKMEERYNISAADVFGNISSGYHGLPAPYNNIPDMDPAPERIVNMKLDEILSNVDITCGTPGLDRAMSKNYKYLTKV